MTGNQVKGEIVTARKKGTKIPLNTFFVNIVPHDNNKRVKEIQYIYNQRVLIEDPKRQTSIAQCVRCQQYGHTKNNCMRPFRCVKCAGPHKTTMCTKSANTPALCCLCTGSHPANYKGCKVYKEILSRKIQKPSKLQNIRKQNEAESSKRAVMYPHKEKDTIVQGKSQTQLYSEVVRSELGRKMNSRIFEEKPMYNVDNRKSQRTPYSTEAERRHAESNDSQPKNKLETLIINQAEKIDQLLQHMGTL
ncbi:jg8323, partial [Pararge aegeria aegeria]